MPGWKPWNHCHIGHIKSVIKLSHMQVHWLHCSFFFLLLLSLPLLQQQQRHWPHSGCWWAWRHDNKQQISGRQGCTDRCLNIRRLYHPASSCSAASWGFKKQFWLNKFKTRKKGDKAGRTWQIFYTSKHTPGKAAGSRASWSDRQLLMWCYRGCYSRRGITAGEALQELLEGDVNVETGREHVPISP